MIMRSVGKVLLVAVALVAAGCSRDHIKAVELANKGDKMVKVNVEGALKAYTEASQLDPENHLILYKLAMAYKKKEDWSKVASTLSRASRIAPDFANYRYHRGLALVQLAKAGEKEKYEEAKDPFQKCIQTDPNFAECYHYLGECQLWTDHEKDAIENFTKAIEHDPTNASFYVPLAQAYLWLRMYREAGTVLSEGTRIVLPGDEKVNSHLYSMHILRFQVAQALNDKKGMVEAMEEASEVAGDKHPEISFNLGSTYAVMDPPRKEKAVRLLKSFNKRACKGRSAEKFKEQCATSASLIQKLGGQMN